MSGAYYLPLWTDAYLGDTRHLSTVQHGAYLLILMAMWRYGGSLPNDEKRLARIAGLSLDKWRKAAPEIMEFLTVEGDQITQKRLKLELEKTLGLARNRALAGSAGGRKKASNFNARGLASASGLPEQNGSLQIQNQNQEKKEGKGSGGEKVETSGDEDPDAVFRAARSGAVQAPSPTATPDPLEPANDPGPPAGQAATEYVFEAGAIRLIERDWNRWKTAFPTLNLAGELTSMADWADRLKAEGKNWFTVIPNQLIKLERKAKAEREKVRIQAEAEAKAGVLKATKSSRPAI